MKHQPKKTHNPDLTPNPNTYNTNPEPQPSTEIGHTSEAFEEHLAPQEPQVSQTSYSECWNDSPPYTPQWNPSEELVDEKVETFLAYTRAYHAHFVQSPYFTASIIRTRFNIPLDLNFGKTEMLKMVPDIIDLLPKSRTPKRPLTEVGSSE